MRIALASVPFINKNTAHNLQTILHTVEALSASADVILFGEAFLQGFDSPVWDYTRDEALALAQTSDTIDRIRAAARQYATAVCFGYIEKDEAALYSSQMFIGDDGSIVHNFRRVSPGWKEPRADSHYREGDSFAAFDYKGKRLAIALCGDLWQEGRPEEMRALQPDAVLWPVYCDYSDVAWNTVIKFDYARQAGLAGRSVLLVNSICGEAPGSEVRARGGAAHFWDSRIRLELPAGEEGFLFANI